MYTNLGMFQISGAMARHASDAQAQSARNLANADTPGYRARQLESFQDVYSQAPATLMRTTRPGHIQGVSEAEIRSAQSVDSGGEAKPNGNTVSLEEEMVAAVDNQRQHERALAIYGHTLRVLRTSIGRG